MSELPSGFATTVLFPIVTIEAFPELWEEDKSYFGGESRFSCRLLRSRLFASLMKFAGGLTLVSVFVLGLGVSFFLASNM